jgi:glycosyltransferase involved in cell wall biosynthesis
LKQIEDVCSREPITRKRGAEDLMQRLFFINRFFFPDHSATSQILSGLAFHLAAAGWKVHVITSQQLYDHPETRLAASETVRGVRIHRIPTTHFGRSALLGRGVDYASFYVSLRRSLLDLVQSGDILIAKTDPPLISIIAMRVAEQRGAHLINWLQDLYPEVAAELGVPFLKGPVLEGISNLRDGSLKTAAANVAVGQIMGEKVEARGVSAERIRVIHNWSDDEEIYPVLPAHNPLRNEWSLAGKFVVGYSGNLGRAHEFETILGAAERLRDRRHIVFSMAGGGHQFALLAAAVKDRGLDERFRFSCYQDSAKLKYSLGVADIHWISLKPEVEGLIVPSKFYGIAAAGRATIAISAKDGEIARLVDRHQCGLIVEPGNASALANALLSLSNDPNRICAMGSRARTMLDAHFTRRQAFERWTNLLESVRDLRKDTAGAATFN